MNARFLAAFFVVSVSAPFAAHAKQCAPVVKDGWVRLGPVAMPMMAGFGRIENPCPQPVAVVSARSPAFGDVSIHESRVVDGVNRMRELAELPVAAKSGATLAPGGLHLMLMRPSAPLKEGDRIAVTFKLKDGREVSGKLVAKKTGP
ncbi:copper chaperone PCu(A)C [Pseudoxanthomonas helianthi]|uniref:Copper chaperone PCu(A)C n=1 Tax=Pseudoxanthomonas helianthi TaxID=1453541 RepID=A0A940X5U5_9GAMM|nr:copper chaperone PCu(A)C [Pseudoxanthomonas helianthi]MBP3984964.1 copper chaperone PCu(A)C [Pseudoxanthomonas helianthi]